MTTVPSPERSTRDLPGPSLSQQLVAKASSVIVARHVQLRAATLRSAMQRLHISPMSRGATAARDSLHLPTWAVVALSVVLGGVVTAAVAMWSTQQHARSAADTARRATPMLRMVAKARALSAARVRIAPTFEAPTASETIDAIARALPPESRLLSASRDSAGRLSVVVLTADPDLLRRGIAEQPVLAGLHDRDQRPDPSGAMRVVLRSIAR